MQRLSVDRVSNGAFVVAGELDRSTTARFDSAVADAARAGDAVVLDLSRVTFIDSSGLRSLIRLGQTLQGIGLVLHDPSPKVRRVLEIRGLDDTALWTIRAAAE